MPSEGAEDVVQIIINWVDSVAEIITSITDNLPAGRRLTNNGRSAYVLNV
jgi:hypothetical protein